MTPKKDMPRPGEPMLTPADRVRALVVELKRIRTLFKEIASNYVTKMESEVLDLIQAVESQGEQFEDQIPSFLRQIRELSVKPNKGRRKDLRKLEELVEAVRAKAEDLEQKKDKEKEKTEVAKKLRRKAQPATRAISVPA